LRRSGTFASDNATLREEAFRILRSNLEVALLDLERSSVLITSAYEGEGKTGVCANLAISLALGGKRVLVVDFDLRKPSAHMLLEGHNEAGLTDVLLDRHPVKECLQYVEIGAGPTRQPTGLYLLAAGSPVTNPTELLGTPRVARLLDVLARQADVVLLDAPPVLPVADTLVIGRMAAGALLVVEARRTPHGAIARAKDALIRNQTRILGIVLNKQRERDTTYSYGGYGYVKAAGERA
jgi:capsular exopolysaccharide synthesis family protein